MQRAIRHLIALCSILVLAFPVQADAQFNTALFRFKGKVTDQIGRALSGVTVSDGSKSVTTASDGTYIMGETSLGTYTLTASRSDADPVSKQATVTNPKDLIIDFSLPYKAAATLAPAAVTVAQGSATVTLEAASHAPLPGTAGQTGGRSCVTVLDTMTGAEQHASYVSTSSGVSTFRSTTEIPAGTEDTEEALVAMVVDCDTDALLSKPIGMGYLVDNTPPVVAPGSVLPPGGGHTAFASQPIIARLHDAASGLDPQSLSVTVTDETTGSPVVVASFAAGALTIDPSGRVESPAVALIAGRTYRTTITARDLAGNVLTHGQATTAAGGGFGLLTLDLSTARATASIPSSPCVLGPVSGGYRNATCFNVKVNLGTATFGATGLRHGGHGVLFQTVPLTSAVLRNASGQTYRDPLAGPAWQTTRSSMLFEVPENPATSSSITAPATTDTIAIPLTMRVPGTWTSAAVEMASTTSTGAAVASCAVPGSESFRCGPDPVLRFSRMTVATGTYEVDTAGATSITGLSAERTTLDTNGNIAGVTSVPVNAQPRQQTAGSGGSDGFGECPTVNDNNDWRPYEPWDVTLEEPDAWSQYVVFAWSHKRTDPVSDDAGNEVQRRMWGLCSAGVTDAANGWRTTETGTIIAHRDETRLSRRGLRFVSGPSDCEEQGSAFRICEVTIGIKSRNFTAGVTISIQQGFHDGGPGPGPMHGITQTPTKNMAHGFWKAGCNAVTQWACGVQEAEGTALEAKFQLEPDQPASVKAEFPVSIWRVLNCGSGCMPIDPCDILCIIP